MDLEIHVVSYKRPAVLAYTLDSLLQHMTEPKYFENINLRVYCNEACQEDMLVGKKKHADQDNGLLPYLNGLSFFYHQKNAGKAYALNTMKDKYGNPNTVIVTLDGDMVFTDHYMELFETTAEHLRFDLVGFASEKFFASYPQKHETVYYDWRNGYKVWHTMSIAGGIMMGTYDFFSQYEWTNVDGKYGGDDFNMSFNTDLKFVVEDERDWLVHDPLGPTLPELKRYYEAKEYYRLQGLHVYPDGWYENAPVNS